VSSLHTIRSLSGHSPEANIERVSGIADRGHMQADL